MSSSKEEEVAAAAPEGEAAAAVSEEEIRARAMALAQTMRQEDVEGLKDIQNHMIAMGLPAARALLRQLVEATTAAGSPSRQGALAAIAELSPVTEVGCMRIDFHDRTKNRANTAYLTIEECPRDHNLDAQLNKLRNRCAEARWPEVLRSLSRLVFFARMVYAQSTKLLAARDDPAVAGLVSGHEVAAVDPANTTLYLDESWPTRAGIFVRLEKEVGDKKRNK